jgi:hypothetical protein
MFLGAINMYADGIADKLNALIVQLVKMKFGDSVIPPKIKFVGINDKAGKETAEIITLLCNAGLLDPRSDALQDHVSDAFRLPKSDKQSDSKEVEEVEEQPEVTQLTANSQLESTLWEDHWQEQLKQFERAANRTVELAANRTGIIHSKVKRDIVGLTSLMSEKLAANIEPYITKVLNAHAKGKDIHKVDFTASGYIKAAQEFNLSIAREHAELALGGSGLTLKDLRKGLKLSSKRPIDKEIKENIADVINQQLANIAEATAYIIKRNPDTNTATLKAMIAGDETLQRKITEKGVALAASNSISLLVKTVRNDVFVDPVIEPQIDSYIFSNPAPDSAVCKNFNGRVFSVKQYKTSEFLPPLHHNCKSVAIPQWKKQANKKPLSPLGLLPTGTESEVAAILKSIKFSA